MQPSVVKVALESAPKLLDYVADVLKWSRRRLGPALMDSIDWGQGRWFTWAPEARGGIIFVLG